MKKIRVQVQGGLGNQLFTWAMAHEITLQTRQQVELVYVNDKKQRLDRPNELYEIANHCSHAISVRESLLWGYIFRIVDKANRMGRTFHLIATSVLKVYSCSSEFEIPAKKVLNAAMIRGFFLNSKMVNRNRLVLNHELQATLMNIYSRFKNVQTIHIRRGDTIEISNSWGILSEQYYEKLIDASEPMVICTDSEELAKSFSKKYPKAEFSTPKTETAWQTLKILSQGNQFVGGNSTLSWWAAWLVTSKKDGVASLPRPWRPYNEEISNYLHLDRVAYQIAQFEGCEQV